MLLLSSKAQAIEAITWMKQNFKDEMTSAVQGSPFFCEQLLSSTSKSLRNNSAAFVLIIQLKHFLALHL
jgi:hypothetical protein